MHTKIHIIAIRIRLSAIHVIITSFTMVIPDFSTPHSCYLLCRFRKRIHSHDSYSCSFCYSPSPISFPLSTLPFPPPIVCHSYHLLCHSCHLLRRSCYLLSVIPAKAGIQYTTLFHSFLSFLHKELYRIQNLKFFNFWIPAFAGMTDNR